MSIAGIVLAAGESRRMGKRNKLLETINNRPLITYAIDALILAKIDPIIVVTGYESRLLKKCLNNKELTFMHNPNFKDGMSTSLKVGISALPDHVEGAIISLGDMPLINSLQICSLIEKFNPQNNRTIIIPTSKGKHGNPVLLGSVYFPDLLNLTGDTGAKKLISNFKKEVCEVECGSAVITDVDDPVQLANLKIDKAGD